MLKLYNLWANNCDSARRLLPGMYILLSIIIIRMHLNCVRFWCFQNIWFSSCRDLSYGVEATQGYVALTLWSWDVRVKLGLDEGLSYSRIDKFCIWQMLLEWFGQGRWLLKIMCTFLSPFLTFQRYQSMVQRVPIYVLKIPNKCEYHMRW